MRLRLCRPYSSANGRWKGESSTTSTSRTGERPGSAATRSALVFRHLFADEARSRSDWSRPSAASLQRGAKKMAEAVVKPTTRPPHGRSGRDGAAASACEKQDQVREFLRSSPISKSASASGALAGGSMVEGAQALRCDLALYTRRRAPRCEEMQRPGAGVGAMRSRLQAPSPDIEDPREAEQARCGIDDRDAVNA